MPFERKVAQEDPFPLVFPVFAGIHAGESTISSRFGSAAAAAAAAADYPVRARGQVGSPRIAHRVEDVAISDSPSSTDVV